MNNHNKYTPIFILLLVAMPLGLQAFSNEAAEANLVAKYFAKHLHTKFSQIEVELLHVPEIDTDLLRTGKIEVQAGRGSLNLGHQTLWLVYKLNGRVKRRYPITVEVYANLMVPTAVRNISRLETLTEELIVMAPKRVGREYHRILIDPNLVYAKMATQMIREGRVIERNMVRTRPDVLLGAALQIKLVDEGLVFELPGIAREEAQIGEQIRVQCPTTRKEFQGILENENLVLVSLR